MSNVNFFVLVNGDEIVCTIDKKEDATLFPINIYVDEEEVCILFDLQNNDMIFKNFTPHIEFQNLVLPLDYLKEMVNSERIKSQ